jgi:glycosyltransferase involved in cell wall biosynthesis
VNSTKRILVEGWRFSPNSLAVLSQFQCLEMLRRPGIELYHRDVPFWTPRWTHIYGLLAPDDEAKIRSLPAPPAGIQMDAALRIAHPTLLKKTDARRSWCWIVAEYGILEQSRIADGRPVRDALNTPGVGIVTCSNWSKTGLVRSGADPANVAVVPLGIDPRLHRPADDAERRETRRRLQWDDHFVFLHISTLWWNKGVGGLLQAFALISQQHPKAILVLKGNDRTLAPDSVVSRTLASLPPAMQEQVRPRLRYVGEYLSIGQMADLYRGADAYVAPYLGEGFNLPVLEAAACGCPVICTGGGSTDDFTTSEFCRRIRSQPATSPSVEQQIGPGATLLRVDGDHLVELMRGIVTDEAFRAQARVAGPAHAQAGFTWEKVVDRLLVVIAPD